MKKLKFLNNPVLEENLEAQRKEIIDTLFYAIEKKGLSQRQVCTEAGICESTLAKAKSTNRISLEVAILLADVLGLEIVIQEKGSGEYG